MTAQVVINHVKFILVDISSRHLVDSREEVDISSNKS